MPPYWHFCVCVCEFWGTNTGPPVCKASTLPTNSSSQLSQDILKGHFLAAVGKRQRNTCCVFFYTCCCHLGFLLKCVSHSPRCARAHWAAAGHPFPVSPSSLCEFCRIQWLYHSVLMDFLIFYHYSQAAQTISQASPVFHMNFPRECSLLFYFFSLRWVLFLYTDSFFLLSSSASSQLQGLKLCSSSWPETHGPPAWVFSGWDYRFTPNNRIPDFYYWIRLIFISCWMHLSFVRWDLPSC